MTNQPFNNGVSLKEYFEKQISRLYEIFAQEKEEIRSYFNERLANFEKAAAVTEEKLQRYFDIRMLSVEEALRIFRDYIDARFKEVNEFRNALKDVIEFQASAKSLESAVKGLEAESRHLKELLGAKADRDKVDAQMAIMQVTINTLEKYKATMEGKASQTSVLIAIGFSVIGLVLTLINMFN